MAEGLTRSEQFVAEVCERAFLRLWTHPNPTGKKGKELCDCLIVCGQHIVIVSVKENVYRDTGDATGWDRWMKVAIDKSASQIWGAERYLESVDEVIRADGRRVSLPANDRRYHRISVSLGSKGHIPIKWGDLGNGFVLVCNEDSVGMLFGLLDTISDFVTFLNAIDSLVANGPAVILDDATEMPMGLSATELNDGNTRDSKPVNGTDAPIDGRDLDDLIAMYISNGYSFELEMPDGGRPEVVLLSGETCAGFMESEQFREIQEHFRSSYTWDRLIGLYIDDLLTDGMFDMHSGNASDNELALITMALQPRGYRKWLADAFIAFLTDPSQNIRSRVARGYADTAFVYLVGPTSEREARAQELALRCMVVRGRLPGVKTVVGIAMDRPGISSSPGYSSDLVYVHIPEWSRDQERNVAGIQRDLGYFSNSPWSRM